MKAYFNFGDELEGIMEMNEENIQKADDICYKWTGSYCIYVLGIDWDEENKMPRIFANGPWEC